MAAIPQAAIAASVIVGLLAVPAASKEVEITGEATADIPEVSADKTVPKQVSRTVSPRGFAAVIETAFNRFSTSIASGSANATLESPASELEVERTPGRKEWVLTTPDGTLHVVETSEKLVRKVSTPGGDLRIVTDGGARKVSFTGSDRRRVEKTMNELRQLLEQKRQQLEQRKQQLRQRAMPDIEIVASESTATAADDSPSPEHVVIVNHELDPVSLEGWTLTDSVSTYEFGGVTLEPGEKLHVYSATDEEVDGESPAVYGSSIAWNDGGDTATLRNADGEQVARESY